MAKGTGHLVYMAHHETRLAACSSMWLLVVLLQLQPACRYLSLMLDRAMTLLPI